LGADFTDRNFSGTICWLFFAVKDFVQSRSELERRLVPQLSRFSASAAIGFVGFVGTWYE
jgi:hypothetical protein